ncbi:hypothetical protein FHR83_002619 [Actinoplanes campanulatus]|uniref:Uncharacterized protein n=1 Tax=Actinoplanes campanulatus TaxID=113559 RepID=A0A7W5AF95_9ACTN|nr:hypothetical protein [Actinoplanes campanulatus]
MKRFLAVVVPVAWGVAAALWTPRGPLTGGQALWSIAISLVVGVLAGRAAGTRWMILGAPLAYAIAFELARMSATGPSVDAPHPSVLGLLVLITGRGVHGLLALFPMAAGAAWGSGVRRRIPLGLAAAGLVLAAVPARTERIPGGVAELAQVGGLRVMIRGRDAAAPVLLFVPGPPGGRDDLVDRLTAQGPPPWPDVYDYEPFQLHTPEVYGIAGPPFDLGVPEYTPLARAHVMTTMPDAWDALYPNLQDVDLRRDVPELAIPAYFVQGGREMRSLAEPFATWYTAPARTGQTSRGPAGVRPPSDVGGAGPVRRGGDGAAVRPFVRPEPAPDRGRVRRPAWGSGTPRSAWSSAPARSPAPPRSVYGSRRKRHVADGAPGCPAGSGGSPPPPGWAGGR